MKLSNWFKLMMLGLMITSFTAIGCDDKDGAHDDNDTTAADVDMDNDAEGDMSDVGEAMKETMMEMAEEMKDVAESVESVEDAQNAEPKIEEMMNKMVDRIQGVVDNMGSMTIDQAMAMQNFMEDPELKKAMEEADAAMAKLKTEHPDAHAKLEELGQKHATKMQNVMTQLMQKAMQMQSNMGDGAAPPAGDAAPGDTAGH